MASQCEDMLCRSADSLVDLNTVQAKEVLEKDDEVDALDVSIEIRCLDLLAQNTLDPVEVRRVGAILKIIADLERIGDLSVDIAKTTLKIHNAMGRSDMVDVGRMARIAAQMLASSIRAFVLGDTSSFAQITDWEEQVDQMYRQLRSQIQAAMLKSESDVISGTWLILAIHHIERAADHCLNIAERVDFMQTGQLRQLGKTHRASSLEM